MKFNDILQGDALSVLRMLPDEIVDTCVTSPPYWALRLYKTAPLVWDGDPSCQHEWAEFTRKGQTGGSNPETSPLQASKGENNFQHVPETVQAFCKKCNAWRGELGLEPTPELYVKHLVQIFHEVKRILKPHGTLWLNLGDCYTAGNPTQDETVVTKSAWKGLPPKNLIGIPWRTAFALQADGWYLRSDIIWSKPNPMPESVLDRPTKNHEYIFLLSKRSDYYYDYHSIREKAVSEKAKDSNNRDTRLTHGTGGDNSGLSSYYKRNGLTGYRNKRTVWEVATRPYLGSHFATFPEALIEPCIRAGASERGVCPKCGKPWVRIVDREAYDTEGWGKATVDHQAGFQQPQSCIREGKGRCGSVATKELGWEASCQCAPIQEPVPAIVLDPFMGSGTTAAVSMRLNRDWIGIELNPEYIKLARDRLFSGSATLDCWLSE